MDVSYFIINTNTNNFIEVYYFYYTNSSNYSPIYPICFLFTSLNFDSISFVFSICDNICQCSTQHKLYLGKEISKAIISSSLKQKYVQS
uniref:Uncharacterized protein n=1 Tax=Polysiphonia sertularioides TaxID=945028 RepID=A0A1Z1MFW2_9FLOR|nr:hypothetical protein [Polysiphonia sertularioides]